MLPALTEARVASSTKRSHEGVDVSTAAAGVIRRRIPVADTCAAVVRSLSVETTSLLHA
jgi:hypothetical protein